MQVQMAAATSPPPRIFDRTVILALFGSVALFLLFILWSVVAQLDRGAVAMGTLAVQSRTKTVQHLEGGIIRQVLAEEGQTVRAGQILIQLDTTQAKARRDQAFGQLLTTWARLDRLAAERQDLEAIAFRTTLREVEDQGPEILEVQENLFTARRAQVLGQLDILAQRIQQLNGQISGLRAQRQAAEAQIALIQEEIDRYNQVAELQATDVRNRLQRERELAQIRGQIGQIDADMARTEVSIGETRIEMLQVERSFQENVATELTDAQDRALSLQDELRSLDDILARTHILAPASGAILNMAYSTVGGVIPAGQPILEIVPLDDSLVVDAQLPLNDVDSVYSDQDVRVTITALNQRTTPELLGTVVSVGADAVTDQATGLPYFPVRITFKDGELAKLGNQSLRPGMATQVFIEAGQRTPLDYFLQPITDTFKRALREN